MRHLIHVPLVLLFGTVIVAQRPTLREMVIETQADVNVTVTSSSPLPLPFTTFLGTTAHVVRAKIGTSVSQLSQDGYGILTTYELRNQQVPFSVQLGQFGAMTALFTLTQPVGTVQIDGFKATVSSRDVPKVTEGMDVILLLEDFKGTYIAQPAGMFEIRASRVVPLDKRPGEHQQFAGRDANAFLKEIATQRQQLQRK